MIEKILLLGISGIPYYSKSFVNESHQDASLIGGLISAINSLGYMLFKKKIATITFGDDDSLDSIDDSTYKIVIIDKEMFYEPKHIFFVYTCSGNYTTRFLKELTSRIFIEIRADIKNKVQNTLILKNKIDHLLETHYPQLLEGRI